MLGGVSVAAGTFLGWSQINGVLIPLFCLFRTALHPSLIDHFFDTPLMVIHIRCIYFLSKGRRDMLVGVVEYEVTFLVNVVGIFCRFSPISREWRV